MRSLCSQSSTSSPPPSSATTSAAAGTAKLDGDIYVADGDYIKDIEVNDLRNRYTLTKGSTQKMVNIPVGLRQLANVGVSFQARLRPNMTALLTMLPAQ